jgi:hypothetical protein
MREERTLQYLVTDSSTARLAFSIVVPGAAMLKCKMAEERRRGMDSTRFASTRTVSASTGVRCFPRIVTTSTDAQVAIAASSISNGLGAVCASPSIRALGPSVRPASKLAPPTHCTSIGAWAMVPDDGLVIFGCDLPVGLMRRLRPQYTASMTRIVSMPSPIARCTTASRADRIRACPASSWEAPGDGKVAWGQGPCL